MSWLVNLETNQPNRKLTQNSAKNHGKSNVRNNSKRQKKIKQIKEKSNVKYIMQVVKLQKWRLAGHKTRVNDNRWTKRILGWFPYNDNSSKKNLTLDGGPD